MTSVVVIDGGGNVLEYVTGDEEAQQVRNTFTPHNRGLYIFFRTFNSQAHSAKSQPTTLALFGWNKLISVTSVKDLFRRLLSEKTGIRTAEKMSDLLNTRPFASHGCMITLCLQDGNRVVKREQRKNAGYLLLQCISVCHRFCLSSGGVL